MIGRPLTTVEFANEEASRGVAEAIAGSANPELAALISEEPGVPSPTRVCAGSQTVSSRCDPGLDAGATTSPDHPPPTRHENLMELFVLLDALRRSLGRPGSRRHPYYGLRPQGAQDPAREPYHGQAGGQLHHPGGCRQGCADGPPYEAIEGFFDVPTDHLTAHNDPGPLHQEQRLVPLRGGRPRRRRRQRAENMAKRSGRPWSSVQAAY